MISRGAMPLHALPVDTGLSVPNEHGKHAKSTNVSVYMKGMLKGLVAINTRLDYAGVPSRYSSLI